jgi:8-oxo-dGTP pyrophosphatase MutT (NUDIX family)
MDALTLADLLDEAEVARLTAGFGPAQRLDVTVAMSGETFDYWWYKVAVKRNRRGEVALALRRTDGQVLLHTKPFYPTGVYRLPTGGVHYDEPATSGALREAREETGLKVRLARFAGLVVYTFKRNEGDEPGERSMPFVTYVFIADVNDAAPVPTDVDEQISGFRYVPPTDLRAVAAALRGLSPGRWADWGAFRAPPHDLVAESLGVQP